MTDTVVLTGLVATTPRHIVTSEGLAITSFRLATNQRRFDDAQGTWVDGDTNWYTVTAYRRLGENVARSVEKGQRVIVSGRVRIRDWDTTEGQGTTVEVQADAIGHDLNFGLADFVRNPIRPTITEPDASPVSVAEPTG